MDVPGLLERRWGQPIGGKGLSEQDTSGKDSGWVRGRKKERGRNTQGCKHILYSNQKENIYIAPKLEYLKSSAC